MTTFSQRYPAMQRLALIATALFLVACGPSRPAPDSSSYTPTRHHYAGEAAVIGSLFPSDTGLLSNEAVAQILDGDIVLQREGRMGILPLGWWNAQDAGTGAAHLAQLTTTISESPAVGEVLRIPRMLLPDTLTVPAIREVAARLRCETVLIYHTTVKHDYRSRTFTKDHVRALITVEAVVFHTRTGIIPCSLVVDRELDLTQTKGEKEWDFWQRAQAETVSAALAEVATRVRDSLP